MKDKATCLMMRRTPPMIEIEPSVQADRDAQASAVTRWNATTSIGAPVRYWSAREAGSKVSHTRTAAYLQSGTTAVVWVEGEASPIALSRVAVLPLA